MLGKLKLSRRMLLTTISAPIIFSPMYYPASAGLSHSNSSSPPGARRGNSGFLARDFISDRLELVRLLKEVTEIEHCLMLQYLYAGFSIKPSFSSLAGDGRPESQSFIGVAVQEMQHLGSINRLLVALGSSPFLDVQDFPFEVDIYPFAMELEPLSRHSVAKYTYCEASESSVRTGEHSDARFIQDLNLELKGEGRINHVGSVYSVLIELLENLHKHNNAVALDFDYWTAELKRIRDEGEESHFSFFKSVFMGSHSAFKDAPDWWNYDKSSRNFPAFDIVSNPTAYLGHDRQINDEVALKMAWLSNLHYWSILVLLDLSYSIGDSSLKYLAIGSMLSPLRIIGAELAKRGFGLPFDRLSLGYSPSRNPSENLGFARQLQIEASLIRLELEKHLPADYPDAIEIGCINQLDSIARAWQQKSPSLSSVASLFSG